MFLSSQPTFSLFSPQCALTSPSEQGPLACYLLLSHCMHQLNQGLHPDTLQLDPSVGLSSWSPAWSCRETAASPWSAPQAPGESAPAPAAPPPLLLHCPWCLQSCSSHILSHSSLLCYSRQFFPFLNVIPEVLPVVTDGSMASGRSVLESFNPLLLCRVLQFSVIQHCGVSRACTITGCS